MRDTQATNQATPKGDCGNRRVERHSMKLKNSKNKAAAKSAPKATATKPEAKPAKVLKGRFIAIGSKGAAYCLTSPTSLEATGEDIQMAWPKFTKTGVSSRALCDYHAKGQAGPESVRNYALGAYVGPRGGKFRIVAESQMPALGFKLASGKVGGKAVKVWLPKGWSMAKDQPSYMAIASGITAGRLERSAFAGERTKGQPFVGKLEIA